MTTRKKNDDKNESQSRASASTDSPSETWFDPDEIDSETLTGSKTNSPIPEKKSSLLANEGDESKKQENGHLPPSLITPLHSVKNLVGGMATAHFNDDNLYDSPDHHPSKSIFVCVCLFSNIFLYVYSIFRFFWIHFT